MSDAATIFEQDQDLDTFGGRLSRAREASGLSTRELAWRLGVRQATIDAWERDRSQPSAQRMNRLSGLLGVSLSWMLHGVGTAPAYPDEEPAASIVGEQLAKLKLLHAETGRLIGRIESRLDRLSRSPAD